MSLEIPGIPQLPHELPKPLNQQKHDVAWGALDVLVILLLQEIIPQGWDVRQGLEKSNNKTLFTEIKMLLSSTYLPTYCSGPRCFKETWPRSMGKNFPQAGGCTRASRPCAAQLMSHMHPVRPRASASCWAANALSTTKGDKLGMCSTATGCTYPICSGAGQSRPPASNLESGSGAAQALRTGTGPWSMD